MFDDCANWIIFSLLHFRFVGTIISLFFQKVQYSVEKSSLKILFRGFWMPKKLCLSESCWYSVNIFRIATHKIFSNSCVAPKVIQQVTFLAPENHVWKNFDFREWTLCNKEDLTVKNCQVLGFYKKFAGVPIDAPWWENNDWLESCKWQNNFWVNASNWMNWKELMLFKLKII